MNNRPPGWPVKWMGYSALEWAFLAVVVVALVAILWPVYKKATYTPPDSTFQRERWIAARFPAPAGARASMVNDLRARHLREGMSYTQVTRLLGPPDEKSPGSFQYSLRKTSVRGPDVLVVHFDATGRLKRTELIAW